MHDVGFIHLADDRTSGSKSSCSDVGAAGFGVGVDCGGDVGEAAGDDVVSGKAAFGEPLDTGGVAGGVSFGACLVA